MKKAIIAALFLGGCTQIATAPPPPPSGDCDAQAYATLIGKPATAALIVPEPKRSYRSGDPVTLDFRPDRINIVLDGADNIIDVKCG